MSHTYTNKLTRGQIKKKANEEEKKKEEKARLEAEEDAKWIDEKLHVSSNAIAKKLEEENAERKKREKEQRIKIEEAEIAETICKVKKASWEK